MTPDFRVLFEDNHLLALEKPPGLLSQGDRTGDPTVVDLVKAYLKEKYQKPGEVYLGLLHRLDRPTGGVLLTARTSKAAQRMSAQFQGRGVEKRYLAVVEGSMPVIEGELAHYLVHDENKRKSSVFQSPREGAKKAVLRYRTLAECEGLSLLEVQLLSGRKHQIRAQLAAVGCPILGDRKYHPGGAGQGVVTEFGLWAYLLRFEHPVKREQVRLLSLPDPSVHTIWEPFTASLGEIEKKIQ